MVEPPLLSVHDVAARLKVHPSTVYQLCAAGRLPHRRVGLGRGVIRVTESDLAEYLADSAAGRRPRPETVPRPTNSPAPTLRAWTPARKDYHAR
jgi:excisionase family DNA binding protein